MSFWRDEVIEFALDHETRKHIEEQAAWIERDPSDARPYCNLASLLRMCGQNDHARGLLLEAVRLDPEFAEAHACLAEMYAVMGQAEAAWSHAEQAERLGEPRALALLRRYQP